MNIGILGVGVIGHAMAEAFCFGNDKTHNIYLSPRGEKLSTELANKYDNVHRCVDNQAVLDQSDYVFIALLPKIGMGIIEPLVFRKNHRVINLMLNIKLDEIEGAIGKTESLTHIVPLSFISKRNGPIAIYPSNEDVISLMSKLGHVVVMDCVEKIESIAAITGLMTPYYTLLNNLVNWGCENNLTLEESKAYTSSFFEALSKHAGENDLEILSKEMTPGGINEMALNHIEDKSGFEPWTDILEPIMTRLKKSDT